MASRRSGIRVMIADDHAILRSGLKMLINAQADMEVVSEASNGEQAVQAARETRPDVALMDLTMPPGTSAIQEIARAFPGTRVLVLTMHDDPAYLRAVLAAGASGYVLKRSVDAELLAAIRAVHRGGIFIDPGMASVFVQDLLVKRGGKDRSGKDQPKKILSDREVQVLGLVARGFSSPQIAKQIFLSVKTVETYRSRFAAKLGLRTRSDIVRFAVQMGLLTPQTLEAEDARRAR
jgi:two-component system response regulator NreC